MNEQRRQEILTETTHKFRTQEWFRGATVYNSHPITAEPTLEFKVNYKPVFELKNIIQYAETVGLQPRFVIVDKDGKPVD